MLAGHDQAVSGVSGILTQPQPPIRALLTSLIDYAGLFPPAALPLDQAIAKYLEYRRGDYAWALGRFVVPARKLAALPPGIPVSVLVDDLSAIPDADTLEVKAGSSRDVARKADVTAGRTGYVEIIELQLLDVIAAKGLRAKIRTGGVTAAAFPDADRIAGFVSACIQKNLPFKATAGLHHPLRCVRPLTYEANAERGTMHGFVNVFLAAALAMSGSPAATLTDLLLDDDPRSFTIDEDAIAWRGHRITTAQLVAARQYATSFGSCSFEEPVGDLKELQWL
jgi:hypothetical protein